MKNDRVETTDSKPRGLRILEAGLFCLILALLALRATYTEGPSAISAPLPSTINDTVYTLCVSAVLFFSFLLWLIFAVCSRRFTYRRTGIEIPLLLFIAAAVLAGFFASDKRATVTGSVFLLAPLFMAVLLVQLLDSRKRIIILLICIAALGIVNAWQAAEQFFVTNDILISRYENDPATILKPLGIQPNSLNQMLLEHRLYSKDVRGFFTTSNSAGSFAILACSSALALLLIAFKSRRDKTRRGPSMLFPTLAFILVVFLLVIVRSKGAFVASAAGLLIFAAFIRFGTFFSSHKRAVLLVSLLLALAGALTVAAYGIKHDRLPGGNSMLVRWQYWVATAKMVADHPLTGVGPGNFATYYTQYKTPAAAETVSDPHCFVLSILAQYGPLGLLGFVALLFTPLARTKTRPRLAADHTSGAGSALFCFAAAAVLMLVVRPLLIPSGTGYTLNEKLYVIFTSYAAPALSFVLGCWLFSPALYASRNTQSEIRNTSILSAALFAAIIALLIHNLIDFAIFEPAVFTAACAALAALITLNNAGGPQSVLAVKVPRFVKLLVIGGAVIAADACLSYAVLPVAKSTAKISQARDAIATGQFELAHCFFDAASGDDTLSSEPLRLNGQFYIDEFTLGEPEPGKAQMLLDAEEDLFDAIDRNPADYRNFRLLSQLYLLRAEQSRPGGVSTEDLLNKALYCASTAVELYPGSAALHFTLAQIAEQTGQSGTALEHYRQTVRIEDAFRRQLTLMYPGRAPFSRLAESKYDLAKQKIKALSKSPGP